MAKALLRHKDLRLYKIGPEAMRPFIENISPENIRELRDVYQMNPSEFLVEALSQDMAHVVEMSGKAVAVCGVKDEHLWTVFSSDIKKHWRKFVKASPELINFYHKFYDNLYCEVWSENVFVLNWMLHLDFNPIAEITSNRGITTIKFVRCNLLEDSIDSAQSRPVMH